MFPMVNTEVKMPKKMFDALTVYEGVCAVTHVKSTDTEKVKAYLREKHGEKLAEQFKPEYLYD